MSESGVWSFRKLAIFYSLLALALLLAYLPALTGTPIWDDFGLIYGHPGSHGTDALKNIWFNLRNSVQYYPLTDTTWWIEAQLFGDGTASHHIVNVLLHAMNSVLLLVLLQRLKFKFAIVAALIFAFHPLAVESVAWMCERKNLLACSFALLSVIWFVKSQAESSNRDFWVSLLFFALALLSKSAVVALPLALIPLTRWKKWCVLPFFGLSVASSALTVWLELGVNKLPPLEPLPVMDRLTLAGLAPWFYGSKMVVPANLSFIYPRWDLASLRFAGVTLLILSLAIVLVATIRAKHHPQVAFGVSGFFAGMLPVIGFLDVDIHRYTFVTDHFAYFSLLPFCALVAWLFGRLVETLSAKSNASPSLLIPMLAVVAPLFAVTFSRASDYVSEEQMFRVTTAQQNTSWPAQLMLAESLGRNRKISEAQTAYAKAEQMNPTNLELQMRIAAFELSSNNPEAAVNRYTRICGADARYASLLGLAADKLAKLEQWELFKTAADTGTKYGDPLSLQLLVSALCNPESKLHNPAEALAAARKACEDRKAATGAHLFALAIAYAANDDPANARATAKKAMEKTGDTDAREKLQKFLESLER
ncbi:MAG: hypothetical protein U0R49_03565 [Fimbriimonadales bacterium]